MARFEDLFPRPLEEMPDEEIRALAIRLRQKRGYPQVAKSGTPVRKQTPSKSGARSGAKKSVDAQMQKLISSVVGKKDK